MKTLGAILVVACVGLIVAGAVTFSIQYSRTMDDIDERLVQKISALRSAQGYGSTSAYVESIVSGFLTAENEGVIGLLSDGSEVSPYGGNGFVSMESTALQDAGRASIGGDGAVLGTVRTEHGDVRYIALPVEVAGDPTQAVYLRAVALDVELSPVASAIMTYVIAAVLVMAATGVASWFLTGRLLSPIRQMREAADAVSFDDLGTRVPESGDHEFADLSRTMNSMLDRLESSVSSQRQLLDDIRHELKTPITIVRGHLEMMDVDDRSDVVSIRELGISELDRMTRLVDDIDLLSSAQGDQFEMRPIDVGMLTDRIGELASAIPGHPFTITARGRGVVVGDADRLTQAWLQLADNAAKYTPTNSPIEIGSDLDGNEARLWVRDHGAGIPPAARRRIFQRFARVDTNRSIEGSGLGLAIVETIAQAHLGSCAVTDTPGGGATFTIHVPTGQHSSASVIPTPVRAGDVVLQREATT
ncbi:HAMP domain-containing histidine kinase [Microbacterium sp. cx-55]|uniref:sensor histidine kinase n=1 Tax=unclassified Microbacterium TaxID=2609290 RepID=UPI001CBC6D0E|nr:MULTISPECIES: HAMP domain-containing sensor histidine kinase [unclassified Microbacterium]MCC4906802.1 HAMP domain-containing histidine kinase [Microbacterium sp. cx-59]UGB34282.1 HAMP domain-containing histidine kinase [Microbacterium sp. cx-55]